MISKVFSGLTIVIAGAAAFFGMQGKEAVTNLQGVLATTKKNLSDEQSAHGKTRATLKTTQEKLETTEADLESTRGKLATADAALVTAKMEAEAALAAKMSLEMELAKIKEAFKDVDPTLLTNLKGEIEKMNVKIKDSETKIGTLEKEKIELSNTVSSLEGSVKVKEEKIAQDKTKIERWEQNIMQKGTRGHVMAVNSGWGFAVLSIGDKQGAAANKIMIVGRGGQSIGKVKITSVETNQSIADIIPGSFAKGVYVEPGDQVIFTGEDKVKSEVVSGVAPAGAVDSLPIR